MFEFCIENHEIFGSLTQNRLQLDKDKSNVSTFSVILVKKYGIITIQKSSYEESSSFGQQRFVFAHLFSDISIKSNKLHLQSWRKNSPTITLFFLKMTAKVSRNDFAKRH